MSQVATAITDEGEDFNFDSWISQNSLSDIKNIFIKHNATSLSSLSLTSPALQSVMTDQQLFLKHSTKIPLIMIAIQKLPDTSPRMKILIQEDEDIVMEQLKENIYTLEKMKTEFKDLKQKLPQSVERVKKIKMEQIQKTINKINKICNDITNAVKARQNLLVQQLESIKTESIKEQKNNNDDDVKEYDLLSNSTKQLNTEMEYQTIKLATCNNIIETVHVDDKESKRKRKEEIKQIGKTTNDKFIESKNELDKNIKTVQNMIDNNNKYSVDIDVLINEKRLNRILNKINNLGKIVNDEKEQVFVEQDDDDMKWDKMKQNMQSELSSMKEVENVILKGYPNHDYNDAQYKQHQKVVKAVAPLLIPKNCIPYTQSVNAGNKPTFDKLINMDCNSFASTNYTEKNWIQATFNQQVSINTMQIGSSGPNEGWGVEYLNGKGRQLQYKNMDGNWINIMPMKDFKLFEIRTIKFDVTIVTNAIRVYTDTKCYTGIGCWRFFE